jgi:hypothetical protein
MRFDNTLLCGSVVETVNGRGVKWLECNKSPATFEPYMKLLGIITVANVDCPPTHIFEYIKSRDVMWNEKGARASSDKLKEPYSNDYVRWVLSDLCNKRSISLPSKVTNDLDGHITEGLIKLLRTPAPKFNLYPVISLVEDEGTVFGRTKF